jgi:ribosome-associated translation inhibitor RaiA
MDKLDRQVLKHKEKLSDRRNGAVPPMVEPQPAGEQAQA